ncbi:MAG: methyltransferase family protein [Promethearchaeati archaeon]
MFSPTIIRVIIILSFLFFGYNITFIILTKKRSKINEDKNREINKNDPQGFNRIGKFGIIVLNIFIVIACLNIFFYEEFIIYIPRINFIFLGETFQVIGITLIAGGNITLNIAYRELGVYWEYPIDGKTQKRKLVKTGVYSKIRHPIYLSFYLICFGFLFVIQDWLLLGLLIIGGIGLYIQARNEEKELLEIFPQEYTNYMKSTGRFFILSRNHNSS